MALEDFLLTKLAKDKVILLLYVNKPCVVFGRFQNPWIECHLQKMCRDNVLLVRRQSGGGCVYHDQGNVNFSFVSDKNFYSKSWNHALVVDALGKLGVDATFTQRGDIRLTEPQNRKISGSASKEKKDTAFHHGTMLVSSDIGKLNDYIHSDKGHLESKSISSIRSVVANITQQQEHLTNDIFINSLVDVFRTKTNLVDRPEIVDEEHPLFSVINNGEYLNKLKSRKWRYEETPKFSIREKFGDYDIEMGIRKTIIEKVEVSNDLVHPLLIREIETKLTGVSLFDLKRDFDFIEPKLNELIDRITNFFDLEFLP